MKKKLSILIALVMAISLCLTPAVALAAEPLSTVVLGGDVAVASGAQGTTDESHIGSGSWEAVKGQKMELYIAPTVFPFNDLGSFTINDIASISFATKNGGTVDDVDFYFTIYTMPFEGGDASWYGYRLTGEAMYSLTYTPVPDQWNVWTTTAGLNEVVFSNSPRTAVGFYGAPTLADIQAGPLNWSDYPNSGSTETIDYSTEVVKYITFATGSPWYETFEGYIDEITIVLTDGTSLIIDLEGLPIEVDIDIKPGSDPNSINLKSKG